MSTYQERFNYALELEQLRTRINDIEAKLRQEQEREFAAIADPIRTFEVVLRVETRASTWGTGELDKDEIYQHFDDFMSRICEITNLIDEDDSIKVQRVTEVT
jgi:hypothetical protein